MDPQKLARDLVERLVASEKLALASSHDTAPVAAAIAPLLDSDDEPADIASAVGEKLTDLDPVVDLFASDEEIAQLLGELRS